MELEPCNKRGPGVRKFNNQLLSNQSYIQLIEHFIQEVGEQNEQANANIKWERLKFRVKEENIRFSKQVQAKEKQHELDLEKRYEAIIIKEAEMNPKHDTFELESTQRELKEIELQKANQGRILSHNL